MIFSKRLVLSLKGFLCIFFNMCIFMLGHLNCLSNNLNALWLKSGFGKIHISEFISQFNRENLHIRWVKHIHPTSVQKWFTRSYLSHHVVLINELCKARWLAAKGWHKHSITTSKTEEENSQALWMGTGAEQTVPLLVCLITCQRQHYCSS